MTRHQRDIIAGAFWGCVIGWVIYSSLVALGVFVVVRP